MNHQGCVLMKNENYVLSNIDDATSILSTLECVHVDEIQKRGNKFSYDIFILKMIDCLSEENQLLAQIKMLNSEWMPTLLCKTKEDRTKEFKDLAKKELESAYHIGHRKDDDMMGFGSWNETDSLDNEFLILYEDVNNLVASKFQTGNGTSHSILSKIMKKDHSFRLEERSKEYVSYMKHKAWYMFPEHVIHEILEMIKNSASTKKAELTEVFEKVANANDSIAFNPIESSTIVGYIMKDIVPLLKPNKRGKRKSRNPTKISEEKISSDLDFIQENPNEKDEEKISTDLDFIQSIFPSNNGIKENLSDEHHKVPVCTPESVSKKIKISNNSIDESVQKRIGTPRSINYDTIAEIKTNKVSNPYTSQGKISSNNEYALIKRSVNDKAKKSFQKKMSSTTKIGNRVDIMTSKPLKKKDGSVTIIIGLTGTKGIDYLGESMFYFKADAFTYMCQFLKYHDITLGSKGLTSTLMKNFSMNLKAIKNPGSADDTQNNIIGGRYAKLVSVGILSVENCHDDTKIEKILEEIEKGIKSILHDKRFFTFYLIGVWIKSTLLSSSVELNDDEIDAAFQKLSNESDGKIEEFFKEHDNTFLRLIAKDEYNMKETFSTVPVHHMKNVVLDSWFPESEILEILPHYIGSYKDEYKEYILDDSNTHDDQFLFWNGRKHE